MFARDVEMFIEHCENKGLATKTIGSYEQTLRLLMLWLDEQGITQTEKITHMHIIHRSKEVLLKALEGVKTIAAEYGLILNEKKTHICKLSGEYRYLQVKYTLLQNGIVVRRIHPKAITRERRKLKAYKRLLDKGIVTIEEIDGYFRSWLSGNYKYMSRDQIYKMNSLYVKLFGRSVTWKKGHGRLRWLMAHPSAA